MLGAATSPQISMCASLLNTIRHLAQFKNPKNHSSFLNFLMRDELINQISEVIDSKEPPLHISWFVFLQSQASYLRHLETLGKSSDHGCLFRLFLSLGPHSTDTWIVGRVTLERLVPTVELNGSLFELFDCNRKFAHFLHVLLYQVRQSFEDDYSNGLVIEQRPQLRLNLVHLE